MTQLPATVGTTDDELDALLDLNRADPDPDPPVLVSAEYHQSYDLFVFRLNDKSRLVVPREQMEGLEDATTNQLAHMELLGPGSAVVWPDLDVAHYLPHLLAGRYSSDRWKQSHKPQPLAA